MNAYCNLFEKIIVITKKCTPELGVLYTYSYGHRYNNDEYKLL